MKLLTTGRQGVSFLVWPPIRPTTSLQRRRPAATYAKTISQGVAITTPEKAVSRIKITAQPANLSYTSGQALDLSGLSVQVYYNDNTNETLTWASGKLTRRPCSGNSADGRRT